MGNEVSSSTGMKTETGTGSSSEYQQIIEECNHLIKPMIDFYGESNVVIKTTIPEYELVSLTAKETHPIVHQEGFGFVEWRPSSNHRFVVFAFLNTNKELFVYGKDDYSGAITMTYRGKLIEDPLDKIKASTGLLGFEAMKEYPIVYSSGLEDKELSSECCLKRDGEWAIFSRPTMYSKGLKGWSGKL
jgi:hypothetical protein